MYIIFDSNVWIAELGLNSTRGAAVRLFVKDQGAIVVVPEVVRLETERHLRNELRKYVAEIAKNHRQLLTMFGTLKEIVLPDYEAIDEKVASVFGQLGIKVLDIPLSLESARSSFLKAIDKVAPSDKDQQFKDGVLWAECLQLLELDDVYLVTSDKAFYNGRLHENGLAQTLADEAKNYPHEIRLFPSLSDLLQVIKTEVKLDKLELVNAFTEAYRQSIDGILSKNNFAVTGQPIVITSVYATEAPDRLYVEFTVSYECEDITSSGRTDAKLVLKGDCSYSVDTRQFIKMRNFGEELNFREQDGEVRNVRNVVLFADGIVLGHRTVEHSVRFKLD